MSPGPKPSIEDRIEEIWKEVRQNGSAIRCLAQSVEKYRPMLKDMQSEQRAHAKLREAIVEKSAVGIVWAMIVIIGVSVWHYLKNLITQGQA